VSLTKKTQDGQQRAELKKTLQKFIKFGENHQLTVKHIAEQANIDRKTVRKILTEDLDMRKV
jgi:predicted transcriptional regulator